MARRATLWLIAAIAAACAVPAVGIAAPPANDDLANAQPLTAGVRASGSNVEATLEGGEQSHGLAITGVASVWYSWTAPADALVTVDTCGSSFDTTLAVYTGNTVATLWPTRVANDGDSCGSQTSMVVFAAQAGMTYRIAVDGSFSWNDRGTIDIGLAAGPAVSPPPNDAVGAVSSLSGRFATAAVNNAGATNGWNDWSAVGTQSVWWKWTATETGPITVDTCDSDFDTRLGLSRESDGYLYGEGLSDDAGDDCGNRSRVTIPVFAGNTYWIGAGGRAGARGTIRLRLSAGGDSTPPETTITAGPSGTVAERRADFDFEASEDVRYFQCSLDGVPLWQCFPIDRYEGLAEGSHTYRVQAVDVYGNVDPTPATRTWTVAIPDAPNDDFEDAQPLAPGVRASSNSGKATAQAGEAGHYRWWDDEGDLWRYNEPRRSVWFSWTAPGSGTVTLDTCGSRFRVLHAVYTGNGLASLTRVAGNDAPCSPSFFHVVAGTTYWIAIDGQQGDSGIVGVTLGCGWCPAPPPADPPPADPPPTDPAREDGGAAPHESSAPEAAAEPPAGDPPPPAVIERPDGRVQVVGRANRKFTVPRTEVECTAGSASRCVVTAVVTARAPGSAHAAGRMTVARMRTIVGAGRSTKLKMRSSKRAARVVRKRGKLKTTLRITVARAAAPPVTATIAMTLKRPLTGRGPGRRVRASAPRTVQPHRQRPEHGRQDRGRPEHDGDLAAHRVTLHQPA